MPSSIARVADPSDPPVYFEDLTLLESWAEVAAPDAVPMQRQHLSVSDMEAVAARTPAVPRDHLTDGHDLCKPLLMVAHDFQGGYNDEPDRRGYTFEQWQLVDYFVYFSHKTISPPPPAWVAAAHRAGTKILGTIMFEWKESIPGLSQLLRGPDDEYLPLPGGGEGQDLFSPFYADALIALALERGLDGWLVNIEVALELGFQCSSEQWPAWVRPAVRDRERRRNARRLRAWVHYLRITGAKRTEECNQQIDRGLRAGPKRTWHISWYDSVTYPDGLLQWQDALTEKNRPFFQAADSLFTNYTWASPLLPPAVPGGLPMPSPKYDGTPAQGGFHPALRCSLHVLGRDRPRNQIFTGIDVFGRNCYGGHETYKSLNMIMPHRSRGGSGDAHPPGCPAGLSVALFAPGWTWEHDEPGRDGRAWHAWWEEDRKFWRGTSVAGYDASSPARDPEDGPAPVLFYFPPRPLPLSSRGFYTSFARGSGTRWAVRGHTVLDASSWTVPEKGGVGYTDVGASMPQPASLWPGASAQDLLRGAQRRGVHVREREDTVWAGNLAVGLTLTLDDPGGAAFVPLISLILPHDPVKMKAMCVYKPQSGTTVVPTVDDQATEPTLTALDAGWMRSETPVDLAKLAGGTVEVGLQLRSEQPDARTVGLVLGAVALVPIGAALDEERSVEVDKHGLAAWDDFAPWTPFYEVFAPPDRTQPVPGHHGTWIASATFDDGTGRTQIRLPRTWAGKSVVVQALA